MTVTVETPEGIKTGFAVREIGTPSLFNSLLPWDRASGGQAVAVDLGKRGYLFALLQGVTGSPDYPVLTPLHVFPLGAETPVGTRVVLKPLQYPKFVHFRDLNDPHSVENVLDTADVCCSITADHMEDIFGKGVAIKEVSIEITNDPVTTGIEDVLPWLPKIGGHYLSGGDACFPRKALYYCLDAGAFKRRVLK